MYNFSFPHGIMFHHFYDGMRHPNGQGAITSSQFEQILNWLKAHYNLLSASEWAERARKDSLKEKDICITFDDNLLCQYELALPVLEAMNIKAFWFIYTSPIQNVLEKLEIYRYFRSVNFENFRDFFDKFMTFVKKSQYKELVSTGLSNFNPDTYLSSFSFYSKEDKIYRYTRDHILKAGKYNEIMDEMIVVAGMDPAQIAHLLWMSEDNIRYLHRTGHVIGLHSHSHPTDMKSLAATNQIFEFSTNKNILQKIIKQDIFCMSHPCGSYSEETLSILRGMEIHLGFRSNMDTGYTSSLEYPRIDHALLLPTIS